MTNYRLSGRSRITTTWISPCHRWSFSFGIADLTWIEAWDLRRMIVYHLNQTSGSGRFLTRLTRKTLYLSLLLPQLGRLSSAFMLWKRSGQLANVDGYRLTL